MSKDAELVNEAYLKMFESSEGSMSSKEVSNGTEDLVAKKKKKGKVTEKEIDEDILRKAKQIAGKELSEDDNEEEKEVSEGIDHVLTVMEHYGITCEDLIESAMMTDYLDICESTSDELDAITESEDEIEELDEMDDDEEEEDFEDVDETVARSGSQLKKKKRHAKKNKKELIQKIGRAEFNQRKRKAKIKRGKGSAKKAAKRAKLKRGRTAAGKKSARLTKKRSSMMSK